MEPSMTEWAHNQPAQCSGIQTCTSAPPVESARLEETSSITLLSRCCKVDTEPPAPAPEGTSKSPISLRHQGLLIKR